MTKKQTNRQKRRVWILTPGQDLPDKSFSVAAASSPSLPLESRPVKSRRLVASVLLVGFLHPAGTWVHMKAKGYI